ncbi:MAG: hypothetical protein R3C14_55260 [Caldilineaceae bacterium]
MQKCFNSGAIGTLWVVVILFAPQPKVQAVTNTIPTLPVTSITDVQLNNCLHYTYLPVIWGKVVLEQQKAHQPDEATGIVGTSYEEHTLDLPTTYLLAPDLLRKLEEVPIITSTLIYTEATSLWEDPSPDPSGLDIFGPNSVIVSDSEVNEQGGRTTNLWIFDLVRRQVLSTTTTLINDISTEPTDIALAEDGTLLITDDVHRQAIVTRLAADGSLTKLHTFDTRTYGSADPEGADFFTTANHATQLVTADGFSNMVYIHQAGNNQLFDGPCAPNDDTIQRFNTEELGFLHSEGVFALPDESGDGVTYYFVGNPDRHHIYVVYTAQAQATLVQMINIGELSKYKKMASIVVMPNSQIVLVFRGVDNVNNPDENDGILAVIQPAHTIKE